MTELIILTLETLLKEIALPNSAALLINSPEIVEPETLLPKKIAPPRYVAALLINSPEIVEPETLSLK